VPEATLSPAEIETATVERFQKFTNYLRDQKAYPVIVLAQGAAGYLGRSDPEPIFIIPPDLAESGSIDWVIELMEAALQTFREQRDRVRPNIITGRTSGVDLSQLSLEAMFGPPPGGHGKGSV
jgi:hypothetical protein